MVKFPVAGTCSDDSWELEWYEGPFLRTRTSHQCHRCAQTDTLLLWQKSKLQMLKNGIQRILGVFHEAVQYGMFTIPLSCILSSFPSAKWTILSLSTCAEFGSPPRNTAYFCVCFVMGTIHQLPHKQVPFHLVRQSINMVNNRKLRNFPCSMCTQDSALSSGILYYTICVLSVYWLHPICASISGTPSI